MNNLTIDLEEQKFRSLFRVRLRTSISKNRGMHRESSFAKAMLLGKATLALRTGCDMIELVRINPQIRKSMQFLLFLNKK